VRLDASALAARDDVERQKLRAMVDYAYATGCRRRFLLAYFGDEDAVRFGAGGCGDEQRCDVCSADRHVPAGEERDRVHAVLALAARLDGRFGRTRLAALLTGDDEDARFFELAGRGALRREGNRYALSLIRSLEGARLLESTGGEYPTLALTPLGRKVLDGAELALALPSPDKPRRRGRAVKVEPIVTEVEPALLERLRQFRREAAQREAVPAYCVLSDRTLAEIARARPGDLIALRAIKGVGDGKLTKYGEAILRAVTSAQASPQ
jgi:ATP-dependent DNA helicase RecQ